MFQTRGPVDSGVQVDVAAALALVFVSCDLTGAVAVLAMDAPAAAVRDAANLLHIDVDHVPVGRAADLPSAELGRMVDGPPREGAGRSASEALNVIGGVA